MANQSKVEIVKMLECHLDDILEIEKLSFSSPWSKASFLRELYDNKCALYLVIKEDDRIIGYAGTWLIIDEGHITNIAIHPDRRGCGYGEALIKALMKESADFGVTWMTLEVRKSNMAAQSMYEKMGFTKAGVRKRYYDDNEDAYLMVYDPVAKDKI